MLQFSRSFLLLFIWFLSVFASALAQGQLQRISITERSDGNGYVLRYHLTEMVDSYELRQPDIDRIQMELFSSGIQMEEVQMLKANDEITAIELASAQGGIGVEITTGESVFFRASAYPDQNLRDLLVNLEYSTRSEVETLASQAEPYDWTASESETEPEPETESVDITESQEETEAEEQSRITVQRAPARIKFGVAGGIGIANKIGGSYSSETRQELSMGIIAGIDLPFVIFSFDTAIETGVFYTQKGFQNPTEGINAQTVLLDYIEVPVLGKFSYPFTELVRPNIMGGFYTAYRTAAERVRSDGDRNDLNSVTKNVDAGLTAGVGTDFILDKATISLQVRYGLGIPRMFTEDFSGGERPGYLSLLMGFKF